MLLRICLILAILAGAGVIGVSITKVKPHIEGIIEEREQQKTRANTAEKQRDDTKRKLNDTEKELTGTKRKLEDTQNQLSVANAKIDDQGKKLASTQKNLDNTQRELTETKQTLAQWNVIGLTPDQVRGAVEERKQLQEANEVINAEKKIIQKELAKAQQKIKEIMDPTKADIELPPVQGKVLVVDPKWNFVVVDIGDDKGVVQRGVLLVSRNGKLVGKVRVTSVQGNRSIANVLPEYRLDEIMEGDVVINAQVANN